MQPTSPRAAGMPLRALLVVLLLAGFGLWQAWQCSDGTAASPMVGMPSMPSMAATASAADPADRAAMVIAESQLDADGHPMPATMLGLCVTVLAAVAAGLLLILGGPGQLALLRRLTVAVFVPVQLPASRPSLAQLCVSRT